MIKKIKIIIKTHRKKINCEEEEEEEENKQRKKNCFQVCFTIQKIYVVERISNLNHQCVCVSKLNSTMIFGDDDDDDDCT